MKKLTKQLSISLLFWLLLAGGVGASEIWVLDAATGEIVTTEDVTTGEVLPADAKLAITACKNYLTNRTSTNQTHTITVCNTSERTMYVTKVNEDGSTEETEIPPGECETWTVELKPGEALHSDENGTLQIH